MKKTMTVTAWTGDPGTRVRIALPIEQIRETTGGHREFDTGVYRIGLHIGRKWLVVHNYSIWTNRHSRTGECFGDVFWAYDRTNPNDARTFIEHYWKTRHYTDLITGNAAHMEYLFPKEED